jgi:RHS repeat-associated protein
MRPDSASGLSYDASRWYDAANGLFISQDLLAFADGDSNTSRFCGNSPTNFVDPSEMYAMGGHWTNPIVLPPLPPLGPTPNWHLTPFGSGLPQLSLGWVAIPAQPGAGNDRSR